jgi:hypothetical protein
MPMQLNAGNKSYQLLSLSVHGLHSARVSFIDLTRVFSVIFSNNAMSIARENFTSPASTHPQLNYQLAAFPI